MCDAEDQLADAESEIAGLKEELSLARLTISKMESQNKIDEDGAFKLRELLGWDRSELAQFLQYDRVPDRTRKALAK